VQERQEKYFEPEIGALIVQGQGVKNEFMAPTFKRLIQRNLSH
jgi:hypothetical protein